MMSGMAEDEFFFRQGRYPNKISVCCPALDAIVCSEFSR